MLKNGRSKLKLFLSILSIVFILCFVESLFVQGRQITRSPQGGFTVEVAVFAPYTIIKIEAKDRFNKTIHKTIRLSVE